MDIIKTIELQREQAQEDMLCILDGIDQEYLDRVCQVICDRFNIIIDAVREGNKDNLVK